MSAQPHIDAQAAELAAFDAECFPKDAWDAERFQEELAAGSRVIDVRIAGELIGYMLVRIEGEVGHVDSIAVRESFRRKGLAWELSRFGNRWLRDQGCTRIRALIRTDNVPSLTMAERGGFRVVDTAKGYYRDGSDAYVVERLFKPHGEE